uniref:Cell division inhibitor n=1 Tax=Rheinheimera sp. BAL341 TaxID=1708203 RepID=A0A486XUW6_9GAMM
MDDLKPSGSVLAAMGFNADKTMKKLFFDGSCALCRREINWLGPKLKPHLELVDISQQGFNGYAGVSKAAMMQQIHLWQHDHFLIGIDATLHYWQLAGHRWTVAFLRLPPCYWLAKKAYIYWAAKRQQCSTTGCDL